MNLLNNINVLLSASVDGSKINYRELNRNELKQLFNTDYSNSLAAFNLGYRIYRGDINYPINGISIATPGIRESQNTINIYTTLMSDILSSWSEYPKRNRSFICSTNEDKAARYICNSYGNTNLDNLLAIFPKNGTSIGVCLGGDIWISFPLIYSAYSSLRIFNNVISCIIRSFYYITHFMVYDISPIDFKNDNKDEILKGLDRVNNNILDIKYNNKELYLQYINTIKADSCYNPCFILDHICDEFSLLDVLYKLLDPQKNGFRLVNIDNFDVTGDHEVWFSGECIMIPMSQIMEY